MDTEASRDIFHCLFVDPAHQTDLQPFHVPLTEIQFKTLRVADLLEIAEIKHRKMCRKGGCKCCKGAVLVKSAWRVNIPKATEKVTARYIPLEHDPPRMVFMAPKHSIDTYLEYPPRDDTIYLFFESTFDLNDKLYNVPESNHPPDISDDATQSNTDIPRPDGLRVTPSANKTDPVALLAPSYTSLDIGRPGVFVDKTRYILALDDLLSKQVGCLIALPPGTGKTTLKSMIAAWHDIGIDKATFSKVFGDLEITNKLGRMDMDAASASARQGLCLMFDLNGREITAGAVSVLSINSYLCKTIDDFVKDNEKYIGGVGVVSFSLMDRRSPLRMLAKLYKSKRLRKNNFFVVVDNWDAPFQASLKDQQNAATTAAIEDTLYSFLDGLCAHPQAPLAKILVIGNFPFFKNNYTNLGAVKDISLLPSMSGAFGMTRTEVDSLFSVLSYGRHGVLDRHAARMDLELGVFSLPTIYKDDNPPYAIYNFDLVLHYAASTLDLDNMHKAVPESPVLQSISQICRNLLEESSLRRGRAIVLAPLRTNPPKSSPLRFVKKEEDLWTLLFYWGVLKVTAEGRPNDPDPTWTLEIASTFAEKQLFSAFPPVPQHALYETDLDIRLRALFERNPGPLVETLVRRRLSTTPLLNLYEMSEAVFQEMVNGLMDDDKNTYGNHYFQQFWLLTDSTKPKEATAVHKGDQDQVDTTWVGAGQGYNGILDIFICEIRRLHRRRVVAMELKSISLKALFRLLLKDVRWKKDLESNLWEACRRKMRELDQMSLEKLRQVEYLYYSKAEKDGKSKYTPHQASVGGTLDAATKQLRSYMNAIANGEADLRDPPLPAGITAEGVRDKRVRVHRASNADDADEIIGVVACCIGRRIVTIVVEPDIQNTKYRFSYVARRLEAFKD
ncbi:hypothetical protein FB451DRAFT_1550559 [Mycena latifolia]|nr:hypothetical protein FB451DRAFT_1550559 [Mycena latifolia]